MKIIICGAGRVGQGLARRLLKEKHTITFVDSSRELVDQVTAELDVQAVQGHASHPAILEMAGARDADAIIAVTLTDEVNMLICQLAHTLFGIQKKIARIRQRAYLAGSWSHMFGGKKGFAIDLIISPELEVAEAVIQRLDVPNAFINRPICEGMVRILGIEVREDFPLLGCEVREVHQIFPDFPASILAIVRDGDIFVAQADEEIRLKDRLYLLVSEKGLERVLSIMNIHNAATRHVIIAGAGNIGLEVAKQLEEKGIRVRIIERDSEQARHAAAKLNRTIVLKGDGLDHSLLEEAGVDATDAVIALTNDDKANLLITNISQKFGAARTLALINDQSLALVATDLMNDAPLDPRALTISKVLLSFRRGNLHSLLSVENGTAEIVEGRISEKSPLVGRKLADIRQSDGYIVGAIVRGEEISFLNEGRTIQTNDNIVAFFESRHAQQVEKFFRLDSGFF